MQKQKLKEVLQTVSITFRFFHSRSEPSHLLHYEETLDFLKKTPNPEVIAQLPCCFSQEVIA